MSIHLAAHARCALVEGQLVFLDLRGDRYSCLGPGESAALLADVAPGSPQASQRVELIDALLEAGLFTRNARSGRPLTPRRAPAPAPASDLTGYPIGRAPAIGAHHTARFIAAATATAARLRWRSLAAIASRLHTRKRRARRPRAGAREGMQVSEIVEVYQRLRPLVFTARERCLYDSLVLLEFLAAQRIFPAWVVGVRLHPFAAHSWVQDGAVVVNDSVANVAAFTPILVV
ncbi:lasso peptide biosynthesis B2 protein [Haliangium ochraceum]|uniref:Microcin J25-processing protein McjB C-terminal domain-containing protein n=1 Tax=Haliangium ochraceum (strain DSM 14365 / JCM 11303 / SMP-2) TaxID=502025 RepID=D0LUU0_HALO1|nr:lasso peptide biosynthesis B2 protein [Haliangium ochraceum]ACY13980.1 conserved hypothetical protein [Haliangium ochraceum DSM 14365]